MKELNNELSADEGLHSRCDRKPGVSILGTKCVSLILVIECLLVLALSVSFRVDSFLYCPLSYFCIFIFVFRSSVVFLYRLFVCLSV